jgi:hypothetical protein
MGDTDDPATGSASSAAEDDEGEDDSDGDSSTGEPIDCGEMTRCGAICTELETDPDNCGACGVSCVVANAESMCVDGDCAVGECDPGFADCDGDIANGCEAMSDCAGGSDCTTACGSTGTVTCGPMCEPICELPTETCNAIDDNCDDVCDEGPLDGCRAGVHRSYSPTLGHFYTLDLVEASSGDFALELQDFYWVYADEVESLVAFYRCLRPNGKRFYTTSSTCEGGGTSEGALGFIAPDERCSSIPLYRLYHGGSNAHFYTTSASERDNAANNLGYTYEAISGYVWAGP